MLWYKSSVSLLATVSAVSISVVALTAMTSGQAMAEGLAGDHLRDAVSGKTMVVDTPVGNLPIRYQANGTMTGQSKAIAQITGTARDNGTWWVSSNKLCQRWDNWLDGKQHCMTIRKEGQATLQWQSSDGRSGTATISR
jgi:hypothetical protein